MLEPGKIYINTELRLRASFQDSTGSPVDPDTVKFLTRSPYGRTVTYVYGTDAQVQRASTGIYTADFTPEEAGRWHYRWETTGTGTKIALEGDFIVQKSAFFNSPPLDYGYH